MKLMIAGGGTGGHLFPGVAVAEEVSTRHPANEVIFVGTDRGLEARVVPELGYPLEILHMVGLKGLSRGARLRSLFMLPGALWRSFALLRRHRPDVVLGVGGYSSGPVVLAAFLSRIPTAVLEINALPGVTNRILGRIARVVFLAFEGAGSYFPAGKIQLVGNPTRKKLMDNFLQSTLEHPRFTVLVLGGSQGARGLNQRVVESLSYLEALSPEEDTAGGSGPLHIVHQAGPRHLEEVQAGYAKHPRISSEVVPFIEDMSAAYATADLVVGRAGAATVAELGICKKASILVPFPHAADNHQELNARAMVDAGAALMIRESELTGEQLANEIHALQIDPDRRARMERSASALGRPEAAKELADVCVELMVRAWGPGGRHPAALSAKKKKAG